MVSNTLPLGGNKDNTALILVMAYLNGSDGSKKPETPHVGSAPDWCSVSVAQVGTLENHYMLSLTALSSNQTGANPQVVDYGYSPQEDSKYIYSVTII